MPDRAEVSTWLPPMVSIGGVDLYETTVQARLWLEKYASKWWGDDDTMDVLATAWALAHGRTPGVFSAMTNENKAQIAIGLWAASLPVTIAQLREAMTRIFGIGESVTMDSPLEGKNLDPFEWGDLIGRVVVSAKVRPDDVLIMTEAQLMDIVQRDEHGDKVKSDRIKTRAHEALRLAKVKILEDHTHKAAA